MALPHGSLDDLLVGTTELEEEVEAETRTGRRRTWSSMSSYFLPCFSTKNKFRSNTCDDTEDLLQNRVQTEPYTESEHLKIEVQETDDTTEGIQGTNPSEPPVVNSSNDSVKALQSSEWEQGLNAIMKNDVNGILAIGIEEKFKRALTVWRNRNGEAIPHVLCRSGQAQTLSAVLQSLPFDTKSRLLNDVRDRERGLLPLHVACAAGSVTCVKVLLEHSAKARDQFDRYGLTPLHRAAIASTFEESGRCAELLLEAGADMLVRDHAGFSAWQKACFHGNLPLVQVLLKHTESTGSWAIVASHDKVGVMNGKTMLHVVARFASRNAGEIISLLCDKLGSDVDARCKEGLTPLLEACIFGNETAAKALLLSGADPNKMNSHGRNAIHLAMLSNMQGFCQILLEDDRVDIDAQDDEGASARVVGMRQGPAFASMLEQVKKETDTDSPRAKRRSSLLTSLRALR